MFQGWKYRCRGKKFKTCRGSGASSPYPASMGIARLPVHIRAGENDRGMRV